MIKKIGSQVRNLQFAHEDARRTIKECNLDNSAIQMFIVKDGTLPLGNHYHKMKTETFVVLEGGGTYSSIPVNEDGLALLDDPSVEQITKDSIIHVPVYVAHAFKLLNGTVLLCFSSASFDPENMDLIPYKLM